MHQYTYTGKGSSIHSIAQFEHHVLDVYDHYLKLKHGKQHILTPDGFVLPLQIHYGLDYLDMKSPSDHELDTLPHVVLTSYMTWDPSVIDNEIDPETWHDCADSPTPYVNLSFNAVGEYNHCVYSAYVDPADEYHDAVPEYHELYAIAHQVTPKEPDYEALRSMFAWAPLDVIKRTFAATTQYSCNVYSIPLCKHFKSRFPALNVQCHNEPVSTDALWDDTPSLGCGFTCAQIFIGNKSLQNDIYGMKTEKEFVNTLEDNIHKRRAMDLLISDHAQSKVSKKMQDILRNYRIRDWQSEPHHQHQNYSECRVVDAKAKTNLVHDRSGAPASSWLLSLMYVCLLLNHTAHASLNWHPPP